MREVVLRAYRVELDPNNRQRTEMLRHAGCVRFIYNWALAEVKRDYETKKAAASPGEKVRGIFPGDLGARLTAMKANEFPWLREVTAQSLQSALRNLDAAFKGFFRRVKASQTPGYPRFKKKGVARNSFQFPQGVKVSETHLRFPKFGAVRVKERNYVPVGVALKTVTVRERAGRWFATVLVEAPEPAKTATSGEVLGADLGIKTLAVLSDDSTYANPKHFEKTQEKLARLQRRLGRQKKGSNRRAKTKVRIAKVHVRVANQRQDALHKMTTEIVRTKRPSVIVIEDLNVAGMVKNHRLARAVSGVAFAEIRRQFEYKCVWYGVRLVVADRFFPSSKTCSGCGAVRESLELGERTYVCDHCGLRIDRDLNAALNLRTWGLKFLTGGAPVTARGEAGRLRATEAGLGEAKTDQGTAP